MKNDFEKYYRVRKYCVINNGDGETLDPDLKPIVFRLPDAPKDWSGIKNYGLHPDNQVYRVDEVPRKIKLLEDEIISEAEEAFQKSRNKTISGYKLLRAFWDKLNDEAERYKDEIKWMQNVIWKRYYGEWVFIDGQAIWLPPRYYMYLNFFHLSVKTGFVLPDFRIRDWKSSIANHYARTTDEALGNLNKKGRALPGKDGKYEVRSAGGRLFYGTIRPKNRRSGATYEALNEAHETVCTGFGKKATVLSKDTRDSEEFFHQMLYPAWRRMPLFLKPIWVGSNPDGSKLEYRLQNTSITGQGLDSIIYYNPRSTGEVVLDSRRLDFILLDEQGKPTGGGRVDVHARYSVSKQTLSTGNGANIHGFCLNPSTAEEMEEGAEQYKAMCDQSVFYERNKTGQTKTGLMLVYFPAQYCLEGFVDCFGKAVLNEPTERQIRLTKKHCPERTNVFAEMGLGSKQFLHEQRNYYLSSGKPEDIKAYRQEMRKHPMQYSESWIGDAGDMGFPIIKIDARIAETDGSQEQLVSHGKFRWKGEYGGDVEWVPMEEGEKDAKFEFSYHIKSQFANRKTRMKVFNGKVNRWEWQWGPEDPRFVLGGDTFGFDNKQEVNKRRDTGDRSRKSDGGIGGYYPFDSRIDGGKERSEYESDRFILSYRAKPPSSDAYNEDLLMAAIYLGAWVYPERNITNTWEYFIDHGFGGYLKYYIDMSTGKPHSRPGYWVGKEAKQDMFQMINDYLERNTFRERHIPFLKECKDIRGPEYLKDFDRLAAHGAALMGARDMSTTMQTMNKNSDFADKIQAFEDEMRRGWR